MEELELGGRTYTDDELIDLLELEVEGDASLNLAHQLIAAKLNLLTVAEDDDILDVIADADAWLFENDPGAGLPYGTEPSSSEGQEAIGLALELDLFNRGLGGDLEHCVTFVALSLSLSL